MNRLRVLIITDEPIFSFGLRVQFYKWGFAGVELAGTCQQAVQFTGEPSPSLIILDEKFLKEQECAILQHSIGFMAIPMMVLSVNQELVRHEGASSGANKNYVYLNKPCQIAELKTAVESLLHTNLFVASNN